MDKNQGQDSDQNSLFSQECDIGTYSQRIEDEVQPDIDPLLQKKNVGEERGIKRENSPLPGYVLRDQQTIGSTVINNYIQTPVENNTLGLTGFILSIVAFVLSWIPILGGLLWLVGAILSIIGLFKAPRGFAIAGTIISFLMIFVFLFFFMGFMMLAAMNTY